MAGKTRKTGSARSVDYIPSEILGMKIAGMRKGWEAAKTLFDYRKADDALKGMLQYGDVRLAVVLFIAGGLLAFLFTMLANLVLFYVLQLELSMYEEVTAQDLPMPDLSVLVPVGIANFIVYVPFAVLLNLLFERIAFSVARVTGGKGTLGQHLLLVSVVWLAVAITTAANLLGPFGDCLTLIPMVVIVFVGILYLMVYTTAKAYTIVHDITMAHALTINIILMIGRIALVILGLQAAASMLGYPVEGV